MTGDGNLSIRAGKRTMASHCSPSWCDFSPTMCTIITLRINGLPLSITSNAELASYLLLSAILWALFRNNNKTKLSRSSPVSRNEHVHRGSRGREWHVDHRLRSVITSYVTVIVRLLCWQA